MDPTASGDGPTMHSISVPGAPAMPPPPPAKTLDDAPPLYTFTAIPTGESPPERYAETIRRPPPKTIVPRRDRKAASKTPWLLLLGFVFVGAAAAAGVTMWQQSTPPRADPATPNPLDPSTPPIVATPTLELRSTPPGATVRIDGIVTTQTPATIPIGVGGHRLTFEAPGRLPEEREIRVEPGQRTIEIAVELRPATVSIGPGVGPGPGELPTPPDPPSTNNGTGNPDRPVVRERGSGLLSIDTNPWSRVFVGGRSLGETPVLTTRLPAGRHTLTFLVEGRRRVTKAVTIRDGQHTKVSFRLGGD
jgi:serine/threonine-protein kinase